MLLRLLCVLTLPLILSATAFSDTGSGGAIEDNGTPFDSIINITDAREIDNLSVQINGFNHTWVGDLVVNLTHLDTGTTIPLFNRVGRFPSTGAGDSSDIVGNFVFIDGGEDLWTEAADRANGQAVEPGQYAASNVGGLAESFGDVFGGESTFGDWRLRIIDADTKEEGSYESWRLQFRTVPVPEPSSGALLGFCLIGISTRRKRG